MLDSDWRSGILAVSLLAITLAIAGAAPTDSDIETLIARGSYSQALAALEATDQRSARWHLLASKVFDGLGRPARAASEAEKALDLEPGNEAHHLQLGQILLTNNNAAAARRVFATALEGFPDSHLLRVGNGLALNRLQHFEEAEREFGRVLARQPALGIALDGLIEAYLQQVRYEQAADAAARFIAANAEDYRGHYYAGLVAEKAGSSPADAEKSLRRSIARNDSFAPARALLGKVLLDRGRPQEAALMLEGAILLKPDYAVGHLHLARAYSRLGRRQDAQRHMRRVQELDRARQEPAPVLRRRGQAP